MEDLGIYFVVFYIVKFIELVILFVMWVEIFVEFEFSDLNIFN